MLPETAGIKPLRDFDISLEAFLILGVIGNSNVACFTENYHWSDFRSVQEDQIPVLSDRIRILCRLSDFEKRYLLQDLKARRT